MSKAVIPVTPLEDSEALYEALNLYRKRLGWTWKRLILVGVAETIAKQGDNPDLVLAIVDYLDTRR